MPNNPTTTAAPEAKKATREMEITNWKARPKGALKGFFSVTLPSGLIINDLVLFEKDDRRWVNSPSRVYTDAQGTQQFAPIIEFTSREISDRFKDEVLLALDQHFAAAGASKA